MIMKLWDKGYSVNDKIVNFTIGKDRELDLYLAKYDIIASSAHAKMLKKVGLISAQDEENILEGLNILAQQIENGTFTIEQEFEDIHSKIEVFLTENYGDAGKKIHTARSRNDQVLVAIQLFFKDYLNDSILKIKELIELLLKKAEKHQSDIFPGYTHFQAAMPSSFGLWFSAYAESLIMDLHFFKAALKVVDQNPLGSGAGFGSSFPIDREFTTKEMNFSSVLVSSVAAQMLRGKSEKYVAQAIAGVAATLSKMCYDLVLYNSQDLNFVSLPKEFTTGSSIMPHKKNPDVFELTRAHCNKIQGVPNTISLVINNLPSGYHRDFQILKELLFEPMMQFFNILDMLLFAIPQIEIKPNIMNQQKYDSVYTVENINQMIQEGIPFREAYKTVGIAVDENKYIPHKEFKTNHLGSIDNLGIEKIREKLKEI